MVETGGSEYFNPLQGIVDVQIGVGGYGGYGGYGGGGGYCPPQSYGRGGGYCPPQRGYCPPPRMRQPMPRQRGYCPPPRRQQCPPGMRPPGYDRYGGRQQSYYRQDPPAPYHGGGRNVPGSGWSRNAEVFVPRSGTGAVYMR